MGTPQTVKVTVTRHENEHWLSPATANANHKGMIMESIKFKRKTPGGPICNFNSI